MKFWIIRLCILLIGYVFGLFSTGLIYSKITGVDLKHKGSGNTGATNALRVGGAKGGIIVLIGDIIKCVIPMLLVKYYFTKVQIDLDVLGLEFIAGIGVIIGHNFPFYRKFKGGKGVACTGALTIVLDPITAAIGFSIFFLIVLITGYVSLGSIIAVTSVYICFIVHIVCFGWYSAMPIHGIFEFIILGMFMVWLCVFQHRGNIERLVNGNENKIFKKKMKKDKPKVTYIEDEEDDDVEEYAVSHKKTKPVTKNESSSHKSTKNVAGKKTVKKK